MTMKLKYGRLALVLACFLITSSAHARLGDGPGIDDLIAHADIVCAGRIAGYKTVTATVDNNSMWLAIRFIADHEIKGSCPTNSLMILMSKLEHPERAKDILAQLGDEKKGFRFLAFFKATDIKRSQVKFVDNMNGMMQISSIKPPIEVEAGTEKRIEIEMVQGMKHLDTAHQTQIRVMWEKWQKRKHTITNKQEEVRNSSQTVSDRENRKQPAQRRGHPLK